MHAYLHRKEGDQGNAAYWYGRAGKPVCREPPCVCSAGWSAPYVLLRQELLLHDKAGRKNPILASKSNPDATPFACQLTQQHISSGLQFLSPIRLRVAAAFRFFERLHQLRCLVETM